MGAAAEIILEEEGCEELQMYNIEYNFSTYVSMV